MDVVADLPADAQSTEPVQQRERLLGDPTVLAQPRPVPGAAPGDDRRDADRLAPHRRNRPDQLSDIVAVAADQRHLQRDAVPFDDQMMLRASSGTVNWARSGLGPPFIARRTPTESRCRGRTGSRTGPCGRPAEDGRTVATPRHHDRQQRLDPRPQLVGYDPRWLLTLPHDPINNPDDQPIPRSILLGVVKSEPHSFGGPPRSILVDFGGLRAGRRLPVDNCRSLWAKVIRARTCARCRCPWRAG